jgi:hypothetical protein
MKTNKIAIKSTEYTKVNTGLGPILIEAKNGIAFVVSSNVKPTVDNSAFHTITNKEKIKFNAPAEDTWVLAKAISQEVIVTEEVNNIEVSARGNTGVKSYVQDQKTPSLSTPFLQERNLATIAVDTVVESRNVTLEAGHNAVAGDILELADLGSGIFMQSEITDVTVNVIECDQPINTVYTSTDIAVVSTREMNVNGLITPQIFSVLPLPDQEGDMVRVTFELQDNASMDFSTFGGLPELANGCVLRVKLGDGTFRNIFNFKNNGDIIIESFDHDFLPATGMNIRGFIARLTWGGQSKHGVVIPLDGALDEELQLVIQDDLTGLTRFRMKAQGHEPQD